MAEAQLSNITREKIKAAYVYQLDALKEHCEKVAIIAGYGKHLLELIDDTPVTPGETRPAYDGYEASKAIIQDCEDALTSWITANSAVSSKLSTRARRLSQRRKNGIKARSEGLDLSGQDPPLNDRDSWIPAAQHKDQYNAEEVLDGSSNDDEDDDDDDEEREEEEEEKEEQEARRSILGSEGGVLGVEMRGRSYEQVAA